MEEYLNPTSFLDSDHPTIQEFAYQHTIEQTTLREKAVALYYVIRDRLAYYPYYLDLRPQGLKASYILTKESGYCVEKSILMAASCRALGIPARLGFATVRNHLSTERVEQFLGTNEMVFHGYVDLYLEEKWVKATPVFNQKLCEKLKVAPLEFDGREDSIFQEYSPGGDRFMDYIHEYGVFEDMPFELFVKELKEHYPMLFEIAQEVEDGYLIGVPWGDWREAMVQAKKE